MENDLTAKADKVFGALSKALAFPEKLPPNTRAVLGDAFDIVQAFRRDRRSDDGDAVTEEWLRSVGFVAGRMPKDLVLPPIVRGISLAGDEYWIVRTYPIPNDFRPRTRRAVRDLCRAIGIPLKETP